MVRGAKFDQMMMMMMMKRKERKSENYVIGMGHLRLANRSDFHCECVMKALWQRTKKQQRRLAETESEGVQTELRLPRYATQKVESVPHPWIADGVEKKR